MPQFNYKAKNSTGATVTGVKFAETREDLVRYLRQSDLMVISITEVAGPGSTPQAVPFGKKLKVFDLALFTKQLGTMIKGGLPLVRALESLVTETNNKVLRNAITQIIKHIRDGRSLSDGLKSFPNLFPPIVVAIVEAGEKIGSLDTMLERLSEYLSASDRFNRKLMSSMAYPIFMILFFIVAMGVITIFLIPSFKGIYEGLNANLPAITAAVFGFSDFILKNIVIISASAAVIISFIYFVFFITPQGRYIRDRAILHIPVFGPVLLKATVGKFCKTLSTLLNEGIAVPESLALSCKTCNNLYLEEGITKAGKYIIEGETIPNAFSKVKVFPTLMLQMSSVGVESGNLPEMLEKSARFYEEQVETFSGIILSLVEPVLIVFLAAGFGTVAVALYLPLFQLGSMVGGGM